MATQFQRDPKASQAAAVSLVVVAHVARFGMQAGNSVGRMSFAIDWDGFAAAAADVAVAVANDIVDVAGLGLVAYCVMHSAVFATGKMGGMNEMACSVAHLIGHERAR